MDIPNCRAVDVGHDGDYGFDVGAMRRAVDGAGDVRHTSRHQLAYVDEPLVAQLIQFIDRNGVRWQGALAWRDKAKPRIALEVSGRIIYFEERPHRRQQLKNEAQRLHSGLD